MADAKYEDEETRPGRLRWKLRVTVAIYPRWNDGC